MAQPQQPSRWQPPAATPPPARLTRAERARLERQVRLALTMLAGAVLALVVWWGPAVCRRVYIRWAKSPAGQSHMVRARRAGKR